LSLILVGRIISRQPYGKFQADLSFRIQGAESTKIAQQDNIAADFTTGQEESLAV
jgi:hypothetical protein